MSLLDDFLGDLDREWAAAGEQAVRLRVIGSSALMLRTDYRRGTKDADVLELREFGVGVSAALTRLAGKETRLHQRHRIYLDLVASGLPFLPQAPLWHAASAGSLHRRANDLLRPPPSAQTAVCGPRVHEQSRQA